MIISKPILTQRKKSFFDLQKSLDYNREDEYSNLETGDLIFVAYENTLGYFMRGYMGSAWTHVGMIMKYKDEVYVMETADYSCVRNPINSKDYLDWKYAKKSGVMVVSFEKWKSLNKKHAITFKKLQTPEHFDRRVLIQEFLKIQEQNLDTFEVGGCNLSLWSKFFWRKSYKNINIPKSNITCSEMIAKIYQDSDVIKKTYDPGSYYTKDFMENNIEMESGFKII
jgi:hypothetical protein